ncbi:Protein esc1 [Acrodontium crateriforme]|uniref:Protein esc1 n=1 Tax=Acrodontium crateriforme TaxID=150365 RepID=A0AAQ3LXV9_9PEZI|nr:Protein esc1 [Acrodontium crateriforme]
MAAPMSAASQQSGHQGLPSISSLTNGLPTSLSSHQRSPDRQSLNESSRDSGTWPQPQSKHSAAMNPGLQVHTLLNPDDSPHRASVPPTPQSARLPSSATSALPSINQGFHDANRDSQISMDSRRSSIDSRMHRGFDSMHLNNNQPTSPYESTNNSQVSLAASLRRPIGGPMSPLSERAGIRVPRQAPPIVGVGRMPGGPDPTAAKPTQGYAWAFPDEPIPEERRGSDSDSSTNGVSRQNSLAASSFRSSIFSESSQMPHGQRRFDDEHSTTHHHSMQHRAVQSLQGENMSSPGGVGNYSRTPELRVSHKLAERKRRSEMKDLFDDLNKAVPSNGGTKASKWEILTKAIEHIRNTQVNERNLANEVQRLQRDSDYAREAHKEIEMLKTEVQVMLQHLRRLEPNAPHVYGHFTSQLQPGGSHTNGTPSIALPPIGSSQSVYNGGPAPPAAMQGVEYGYGR